MDLDNILDEVGHFGKFQAINYVLVGFPILLSAAVTLSYVFTAGTLEYRCRIPECDSEQDSFQPDWLQYAVPFEEHGSKSHPTRCLRFAAWNVSMFVDDRHNSSTCSPEMFDRNNKIRCHEWVYNGEETTIVNEWGITCEENEWKLTMVGTVNNVGQFIGFPLAGFFSDRLGRRTALVTATVGAGVMGLVRSVAWSYESFLVFEFLDPVFASGIYTAGFVLGMELVGPRARVLGGTLTSFFYALGEAVLGGVALWLQNWRQLLRVLYTPALLCITYYWFLPESVRWLLAVGKTKEARSIILKAAKTNGVVLSKDVLNKFEMTSMSEGQPKNPEDEDKSTKEALKQVICSKILLLRVVNCSFCWATITFVFYGLSLTSVSMGGNKFMNFILVALIELPAYVVFYFTMDKFGRKSTQSASLIISGFSCISFAFIPVDLDWMRMLLFLMGKFSITVSFTVMYVYTTEMFPTKLRHSLLGVCAMVGRIGSMVAPQTPLLVVCTDKFKEVWEVEYLPDCTYETAVRISNMGLFYLMVNVGCKGELHAIVQMVASEEVATTFKYKVNVSSISGHKRVTYSNEVLSCRESKEGIRDSGFCLRLSSKEMLNICQYGETFQCKLSVKSENAEVET